MVLGWFGWFLDGLGGFWMIGWFLDGLGGFWLDSYFRMNES